jgi:hypothetical protein
VTWVCLWRRLFSPCTLHTVWRLEEFLANYAIFGLGLRVLLLELASLRLAQVFAALSGADPIVIAVSPRCLPVWPKLGLASASLCESALFPGFANNMECDNEMFLL